MKESMETFKFLNSYFHMMKNISFGHMAVVLIFGVLIIPKIIKKISKKNDMYKLLNKKIIIHLYKFFSLI